MFFSSSRPITNELQKDIGGDDHDLQEDSGGNDHDLQDESGSDDYDLQEESRSDDHDLQEDSVGDDHDLHEKSGSDDHDLQEDIDGDDCGIISQVWSKKAILQLMHLQKKHQNLKTDRNNINKIIAKELKPWVSYHKILKNFYFIEIFYNNILMIIIYENFVIIYF